MQLFSQHRDSTDIQKGDFGFHLQRLRPIVELLVQKDPKLGEWYLKADAVWEALRYRTCDAGHPSQAIIAELAQRHRDSIADSKIIGLWNGIEEKQEGAALSVSIDRSLIPNEFEFSLGEQNPTASRLGRHKSVAEIISKVVSIYDSAYVTFGPQKYEFLSKQVFEDRPSASWMLYLPRVLTPSEVPEARDLIPVIDGDVQNGTIIVSVIDEVFSVDNAEHVKIANAIEVQLVDQDLLPRFVDL